MRRREFIAGLGGAAVWPLAARAQQRTKLTIGWFDNSRPALPSVEAFRRGLAEFGFSEGRDVTVEYYTFDVHRERFPGISNGRQRSEALAADLVRHRPAAIVAAHGNAALAAKAATQDIPIIFIAGYDPVELGLVASLNRPGGNATGVIILSTEIAGKRLQLLHEAVPAVETVALLVGAAPEIPFDQIEARHMQSAARTLGLRLQVFNVTRDTGLRPFFATLDEHQASGIVVGGNVALVPITDQILSHAARFALPTMFVYSPLARAGGLLSYGPDLSDTWRQMGAYTGRILKGEKPGDLPVIQPTKFELVINLKTAKALGLTIPTNLLVRADEVIEE